jgi:glycosyltransferase involved in cell wall biosynthesis
VRILVASTFVPFVDGGSRILMRDLVEALRLRGHEVDAVDIPNTSRWDAVLEETLAIRLLEVSRGSDLLIATRPPSHVLRHPNKRLWFIHHHRAAYDLWGTQWQDFPSRPDGVAVRDAIRRYDELYLAEAQKIFTTSETVARRLRTFNNIDAGVLNPPLGHPERFFCEQPEDYVFYPSRITSHKRQLLAVQAACHLASDARVVIAGAVDHPDNLVSLEAMIREHGLERRVTLLPHWIAESEKAELIARSLAVLYVPYDEDAIGYVTLEASHARKAIITCTDSGGALELVKDGENGLVVAPDGPSIAGAIDRLRADPAWASALGARAYELLAERDISWDRVVERVIS